MGRKRNIPIDVLHKRKKGQKRKGKGNLLAGLGSLKPAGLRSSPIVARTSIPSKAQSQGDCQVWASAPSS